MLLTVLAVNHTGVTSGVYAKTPVLAVLLIASILNDKHFGNLLQLLQHYF